MSRGGVVAAGDEQTARAGARALRSGGNAVDAVCSAAFASFVCEHPLTSAAGAGLMLHGSAEEGWYLRDFFARVPGLGGRPDTLDFSSVEVDFGSATQEFHVGRGSAAVPGALRGLLSVHKAHGRLPLAEIVAPALELAREGFVVSRAVAYTGRLLEPIYRLTPRAWSLVSGDDGQFCEAGTRLLSPGQAHLLEGLARAPKEAVRALESDLIREFGPSEGGLLQRQDLEAWAAVDRSPLSVPFRGTTVLTAPPPSSGGGLVAFGLRLAERSGLFDTAFGQHWELLARILAAVSRARGAGYEETVRSDGFLARLLSDEGVDQIWWGLQQERSEQAFGSTTHISVLDDEGGAASMTASNGEGCGHVLSRWGVHVNNFLGEKDINPLGFHAQPPGTEMVTMMSPTIVVREGRPVLALGSGGSNRLRSAVLQALVNYLGFNRSLADAVGVDRLHIEGPKLWFEAEGLSDRTVQVLERHWPGASRFDQQNMFFGGVHAAARRGDRFVAVGDTRRDGAVCTPQEI